MEENVIKPTACKITMNIILGRFYTVSWNLRGSEIRLFLIAGYPICLTQLLQNLPVLMYCDTRDVIGMVTASTQVCGSVSSSLMAVKIKTLSSVCTGW